MVILILITQSFTSWLFSSHSLLIRHLLVIHQFSISFIIPYYSIKSNFHHFIVIWTLAQLINSIIHHLVVLTHLSQLHPPVSQHPTGHPIRWGSWSLLRCCSPAPWHPGAAPGTLRATLCPRPAPAFHCRWSSGSAAPGENPWVGES